MDFFSIKLSIIVYSDDEANFILVLSSPFVSPKINDVLVNGARQN